MQVLQCQCNSAMAALQRRQCICCTAELQCRMCGERGAVNGKQCRGCSDGGIGTGVQGRFCKLLRAIAGGAVIRVQCMGCSVKSAVQGAHCLGCIASGALHKLYCGG